jgi:hypothetical protein
MPLLYKRLEQDVPEGSLCHPHIVPAPPTPPQIGIDLIERGILARVHNHRLFPRTLSRALTGSEKFLKAAEQ